jgi:hypothetical protein
MQGGIALCFTKHDELRHPKVKESLYVAPIDNKAARQNKKLVNAMSYRS